MNKPVAVDCVRSALVSEYKFGRERVDAAFEPFIPGWSFRGRRKPKSGCWAPSCDEFLFMDNNVRWLGSVFSLPWSLHHLCHFPRVSLFKVRSVMTVIAVQCPRNVLSYQFCKNF